MTETSMPYGYCRCGCGQKTKLRHRNQGPHGWVKGEPKGFIYGHQGRKSGRNPQPEEREEEKPQV